MSFRPPLPLYPPQSCLYSWPACLQRERDMTFSDRFHERLSHLSLPRPLSAYSHDPPPRAKSAIVMTKQSGLSRLMQLSSALHHWWCYHNPCCPGNSSLLDCRSPRRTIWRRHVDSLSICLLYLISVKNKGPPVAPPASVQLKQYAAGVFQTRGSGVSAFQGEMIHLKCAKRDTLQLWGSPNCLDYLCVYANMFATCICFSFGRAMFQFRQFCFVSVQWLDDSTAFLE